MFVRMKIGVPKETAEGERRVALVPDVVKALTAKEIDVVVEPGAGEGASHGDDEYTDAGAKVGDDVWGADVVLKVTPPSAEEVGRLKQGQILIGFLEPLTNPELAKSLAGAGVTSFAMEAIPRITRAQSMDALSSQANLGGYMSVLIAARESGKLFPMMTTAASSPASTSAPSSRSRSSRSAAASSRSRRSRTPRERAATPAP